MNDLKDLKYLLANREVAQCGTAGIYFLFADDVIVYVGQSQNCEARIKHHQASSKKFNGYTVLPMPGELNILEAEYIAKFQPFYNNEFPTNNIYMSLAQIKREYKHDLSKIKRALRTHKVKYLVFNFQFYFFRSEIEKIFSGGIA